MKNKTKSFLDWAIIIAFCVLITLIILDPPGVNTNGKGQAANVIKVQNTDNEEHVEKVHQINNKADTRTPKIWKGKNMEFNNKDIIIPEFAEYVNKLSNGRMSPEYLQYIHKYCGYTLERTLTVLAVAHTETRMGNAGGWNNNYWGYFKGGNRSHDPQSKEQMAKDVCVGFGEYGRYRNIVNNGNINHNLAVLYSGNDRVVTWKAGTLYMYNKLSDFLSK